MFRRPRFVSLRAASHWYVKRPDGPSRCGSYEDRVGISRSLVHVHRSRKGSPRVRTGRQWSVSGDLRTWSCCPSMMTYPGHSVQASPGLRPSGDCLLASDSQNGKVLGFVETRSDPRRRNSDEESDVRRRLFLGSRGDLLATFRALSPRAVGYSGGSRANPHATRTSAPARQASTPRSSRSSTTPRRVSYEQLLDLFWTSHDPTTLNRQGPDHGTQYRSAICLPRRRAENSRPRQSRQRQDQSGRFRRPIVTEIAPASTFWRAEEYHQTYLAKRGQSSCHL